MGEAQVQRLAREERTPQLVRAAAEIFASRGYAQAGLAEVASQAGVSKTLLYHYFPDGRRQLYREVMEHLVGEVLEATRVALEPPMPRQRRLERLVSALIDHFTDHPDAYRLLILEPWGAGEPAVVGHAMAVRTRLLSELSQLLAPAGAPVPTTMAACAAAFGALLQVCEQSMAASITRDEAKQVAMRFVHGGLAELGLVPAETAPGQP